MIRKALLSVGLLAAAVIPTIAQDSYFKPKIEKVTANGKLFYAVGAPIKNLDLGEVSEPVRFEYYMKNLGNSAASVNNVIYVHFNNDKGEIQTCADFAPKLPTTKWMPGQKVTEITNWNSAPASGRTLNVVVGMYYPKTNKRCAFINPGNVADGLLIGSITVKYVALKAALELKKVTVNGQPFYEEGQPLKTIELNGDWPAKVEYTFVNVGNKIDTNKVVFVHVESDGKMVNGGDFGPSVPTTKWKPNEPVTVSQNLALVKNAGSTVSLFIGLYEPVADGQRLIFSNSDMAKDRRIKIGTIKVE